MIFLRKSIWFVFAVLLTSVCFCQNLKPTDTSKSKLSLVAKEIMASTKTCALITVDNEGNPRVRTMNPFLPEDDFTVWFGTNINSRKVTQIENNPKVTLYYIDGNSGYVTIRGKARIVNDKLEKEKRWKEEWKSFYRDKTKDYILIKFSPEWMEVLSLSRGIVGDSVTWETPSVKLKPN